jgi:hypothetical protein
MSSWWQQLFFPKTARPFATTSDRDEMNWDGNEPSPDIRLKQPFSDGSEEFFGEFMPHDEQRWLPNKQMMIGLGITAGLLAGVGIAVWLRKTKRRKTWWRSMWQEVRGK